MSGSASERAVVVTASARSLPARMCSTDDGRLSNIRCTCPARRSVTRTSGTSYCEGAGFGRAAVSTIGRVDNSLRQSDRLTMAIALTVRLGSFDTLPMAGTRRGDSERDGIGARRRTCASARWARLELHISRAEVDNAELHCARIAFDAPTPVLSGWRRYCVSDLRAACAS